MRWFGVLCGGLRAGGRWEGCFCGSYHSRSQMIPEAKQSAVARALNEAFGVE
jgi:hypothetical protein